MKTFKYFLFASIAVFTLSCDTNDDGFYNEVSLEISNLVRINDQPSYQVGDFLYVEAIIPRYLNESDQSTPLDIRTTTQNATSFDYSYLLEKRNGTEWQTVNVTNDMINIVDGGLYNALPILYANAYYNEGIAAYVSNVGLPLESTGEYRLSFNTDPDKPNAVEIRSDSPGNSLTLNISSTISVVSNGYYSFVVN